MKRSVVFSIVLMLMSGTLQAAAPTTQPTRVAMVRHVDPTNGFEITFPANWVRWELRPDHSPQVKLSIHPNDDKVTVASVSVFAAHKQTAPSAAEEIAKVADGFLQDGVGENGTMIASGAAVVDGLPGRQICFIRDYPHEGRIKTLDQVVIRNGKLYCYSFSATPEQFDAHLGELDAMLASFEHVDEMPASKATTEPTHQPTMEYLKNPQLGFKLEYPAEWMRLVGEDQDKISRFEGTFLGRAHDELVNVRMESIKVSTHVSAKEIPLIADKFAQGGGISKRDVVSNDPISLDGNQGRRLVYFERRPKSDVRVKCTEYLFANHGELVTLTYSAPPEKFDNYLADFEQIRDSIRWIVPDSR